MDAIKYRTAIIALGDTSLRDAGAGQFLIELLAQAELPEDVDIYNCGTAPECFDGDIRKYNRIILITALGHGDAAGEILFTSIASDIKQVLNGLPSPLKRTKDQLIELFNRTINGRQVEWILIGIEPKSVGPGLSISDDVIKAAPRVLNFINDLLWESAPDKSLT